MAPSTLYRAPCIAIVLWLVPSALYRAPYTTTVFWSVPSTLYRAPPSTIGLWSVSSALYRAPYKIIGLWLVPSTLYRAPYTTITLWSVPSSYTHFSTPTALQQEVTPPWYTCYCRTIKVNTLSYTHQSAPNREYSVHYTQSSTITNTNQRKYNLTVHLV